MGCCFARKTHSQITPYFPFNGENEFTFDILTSVPTISVSFYLCLCVLGMVFSFCFIITIPLHTKMEHLLNFSLFC